ncbi:MAG: metal-dependent hydrolase, partial [Methanomicrobiaceae archaeon]|nr:metal-dependent hydrolase [Methanomicrobiaceae archaeon]
EPLFFTPASILPHMTVHSRYFHNIAVLVVFALLAGLVLSRYGHPYFLSAAYAGFGFAAHLFEDALVYAGGGAFLWPISSEPVGIGIFPGYSRDFFEVANTGVLTLGLLFLAAVLALEVIVHRKEAILPRKLAASFQALALFRRE